MVVIAQLSEHRQLGPGFDDVGQWVYGVPSEFQRLELCLSVHRVSDTDHSPVVQESFNWRP